MSELTYKRIIDVEQASALNDTTTVLVNDDGVLKQITATEAFLINEDKTELETRIGTTESNINTLTADLEAHNSDETAHTAIRALITELTSRLNALADSDDTTLDQLSEIVAYIKNNKGLIENVTTAKVNVADIVDDLLSTVTDKPLSANQGVVLKALVDEKVALPKAAGVVDCGTAGQFAVSDGMGGIMWKTLVEAEEVSY